MVYLKMKTNYLKTKRGSNLFLALAEADPKSALESLKRTIGTWTKEELLQFTTGRSEVIWALEKIAIWRDLFPDATRLLLALGEAENETWSNNASGVFAGLFSPAFGRVAPTEASPQERFPILKETLESSSRERRLLALRACDEALESQGFSRMAGAEHQGLRKEPKLWMPKKYGELFDAYKQVWRLLEGKLDALPPDEQQGGIKTLLNHVRGLVIIQNLSSMVTDTVEKLAKKPYTDKRQLLSTVIRVLHYEGKALDPQIYQQLEKIKNQLAGSDFPSFMRRYVGMDLLEDRLYEEDQAKSRIEGLAQQVAKNKDLLRPELNWLVTTEAHNGYQFGYELGKRDKDFSLLPILIKTQQEVKENASVYFLGGYFRALFEKVPQEWEKQLDILAEDNKLRLWLSELTWRSGISDQAALRILNLAKKGIISIEHFHSFRFGGVVQKLSETVLKKWVEFLLNSSKTNAISIAMDLHHFYYLRKESQHKLPKGVTLKLLTHPALFQKPETGRRDQMDDYHWTEIGKSFIQLYPERSLDLAAKIIEHFGEKDTILEGFHPNTHNVINEITRRHPKEVWKEVRKYLGPPLDSRAFHIREWLRGGSIFLGPRGGGALSLMPQKEVWEWIDSDIEKRARYFAGFVPKQLFREKERVCLAREVLVRYGKLEDVRNSLMANFSTEGWIGPASLHYQKKKQQLLDFRKEEDNKNVKRWIDDYMSVLDRRIEREKIKEERRGF